MLRVDHDDDLIVIVQSCRLRVIGRFDALDLIPKRVRLIDADAGIAPAFVKRFPHLVIGKRGFLFAGRQRRQRSNEAAESE